ncbi:MAG: PE domain-containing protein [Mycobacterium sp.]|nr:PE domain-containing protein [Mycobacterium sp.]
MSFVTTNPEALSYAAGKLQTLGSALADESTAAAAPTTAVAPAAADEVSTLQAAVFSAYGSLYQSVSAQAAAIHELFINTLGTSAGSYSLTEAANSVAAASPLSGISGTAGSVGAQALPAVLSGGFANIVDIGAGNWSSAASDLIGMAGGGLLPPQAGGLGNVSGAAAALQAGSVGPALGAAAPAGLGGSPIVAGLGQAATVGKLSVPPSWAAGPAASAVPSGTVTLTGAGWTAAAPHGAPVTTVPAGMPSMAAAAKAGGLGAPRYGVKPTVMGRPAVV